MPPCVHQAWAKRRERWLTSMHIKCNTRGRHLITSAQTEFCFGFVGLLLVLVFLKKAPQVWKACHTHRYRGINNALSNLQPWPGSSRSKPTKKTCTVKRKEKGRQREKATDKQMWRTRASVGSAPRSPLGCEEHTVQWDFKQERLQPVPSKKAIPFKTEPLPS